MTATLAGIAFWTVVLAGYVTLFAATLVSVARAPLDARTRTRWIWFVVLAPGLGIIMWAGRTWAGRTPTGTEQPPAGTARAENPGAGK